MSVTGALGWTGPGAPTLVPERDVLIPAPVTTAGGGFTVSAARSIAVAADLAATGTASIGLSAASGNRATYGGLPSGESAGLLRSYRLMRSASPGGVAVSACAEPPDSGCARIRERYRSAGMPL